VLALVAAPGSADIVELREVPDPEPRDHQALVAVRAISLNRGETRRAQGAADGWQPGWDLAGVVERAAANGDGPPVGARVVGILNERAWAQRAAVATDRLAQLPPSVSDAAAAALPVAGVTALRTLRMAEPLAGKPVLVTGAAGGVGRFAIQLAHRAGAHVTAVVGRPDRGVGLPELGADLVAVGMPAEGPFDFVLESVGGRSLGESIRLVTAGGVVVVIGVSEDGPTTFDPGSFLRRHGTRLQSYLIFSDLAATGGAGADLARLVAMVAAGELDPQVSLEADWRDAGRVLRALLDRQVSGKAVLHVTG
jgi:NADPH:quinone reductase-like Zn-dependent oxidoreductase